MPDIDLKPIARFLIAMSLIALYAYVATTEPAAGQLEKDLKELVLVVLAFYMGREGRDSNER